MRATILSGVMLAASLVAPALGRAADPLDGKSYDVITTWASGRQEENTYSFKDGQLKSAACAIQGYAAAPYTATKSGETTTVKAVLKNARGDTRTVNASVAADGMRGTVDVDEGGETSKRTFAPKGPDTESVH